jgi:hypothetical protein
MNDRKYKLINALELLKQHVLKEKFKGYDPYDGLSSALFNLPFLNSNKLIRFGSQQVIKRSPLNFRKLLGIRKSINPVTLGLSIQAFTYLAQSKGSESAEYDEQLNFCLTKLEEMQSKGYSGICWGYDFDWEGRYTKINSFEPNVVVTAIIIRALFEYYNFMPSERVKSIIASSSNFVTNDLNKYSGSDGNCFSYSTKDNQRVLNASMKAARILALSYSIDKKESNLQEIDNCVKYLKNNQADDGSWPYAVGDSRKWRDNYHTAYVLDSLKDIIALTPLKDYRSVLDRGLEFYVNNFFQDEIPHKYVSTYYPIDCTTAAQSIITLTYFNQIELAHKVAVWSIENMQKENGSFIYQVNKKMNNNISYMRWNNSWMFVAFSLLNLKLNKDG